jgi:hypothetical protein
MRICVEGSREAGLLFVGFLHEDLVVTQKAIQHAQHLQTRCCAPQGINERQGVFILWAKFVESREVDAHSPTAILLWDHDHIG